MKKNEKKLKKQGHKIAKNGLSDEMIHYSSETLINGIRLRDNEILNYIYSTYYPIIRHLVMTNCGSRLDAEDIFQDAIIVIFEKLQKENIILQCSFKTYMYSICRNLWLQRLDKKKRVSFSFHDLEEFIIVKEEVEQIVNVITKDKIFQKHYLGLSENCQKILRLTFNRVTAREIARILGFKSEQYARKRKSQCRKTLITRIKNDPDFKKLKNEQI